MQTVKKFIDKKVVDTLFTKGGTLTSAYVSNIINDKPIFMGMSSREDARGLYRIECKNSIEFVTKKQYDTIQECYIYKLYATNPKDKKMVAQAKIMGWI